MNNSGLKVAAAAVKAAANEMGISYRKCLKLLEDYGDAFSIFDEEPRSVAENSRPSSGPSSLAVAILKNIKESNSYGMVKQYAWSIQQLNAADQAYVISGLGEGVSYAIREEIMREMRKYK